VEATGASVESRRRKRVSIEPLRINTSTRKSLRCV